MFWSLFVCLFGCVELARGRFFAFEIWNVLEFACLFVRREVIRFGIYLPPLIFCRVHGSLIFVSREVVRYLPTELQRLIMNQNRFLG